MRTVESATLGGIDREGNDAANDLTRICLQVAADVKVPYPNIGLRINKKNPDWLYDESILTTASGAGQPMLLNDEIWIESLKKLGFSREDANDYYNMGCVELEVPGKQPSYGVCEAIAFPVLIEEVMRKYKEGIYKINTYDDYFEAYKKELDLAIEADYEEAVGKRNMMKDRCYDPYSSILIDGCLESGTDMLQGGSELPTEWSVYAYGIGTAADSLYAVKKIVFEDKAMTLDHLNDVLDANFEGYEASFAIELAKAAKEADITTSLETSGFSSLENYEKILPYIDTFLWDYKATGEEMYQKLVGASNRKILSNLDALYHQGANIILRCPLIPGVNDSEEHLRGIAQMYLKYPDLAGIEIMPYHKMGTSKAKRIGYEQQEYATPDQELKAYWKQKIEEYGGKLTRIN